MENVQKGSTFTSKGPARGYKWADAGPRNKLAVRHGAHSQALVSERAAAVLAELLESYPWLTGADAMVLDVLVQAKVRFDAISGYISGVIEGTTKAYSRTKGAPQTGVEGVPESIWQQISRESRTIIDAAGKLGLTATDRAQLLKDTGLARHFAGERAGGLSEVGEGIRRRRLRELS